jgi:hypothetical protein
LSFRFRGKIYLFCVSCQKDKKKRRNETNDDTGDDYVDEDTGNENVKRKEAENDGSNENANNGEPIDDERDENAAFVFFLTTKGVPSSDIVFAASIFFFTKFIFFLILFGVPIKFGKEFPRNTDVAMLCYVIGCSKSQCRVRLHYTEKTYFRAKDACARYQKDSLFDGLTDESVQKRLVSVFFHLVSIWLHHSLLECNKCI